jgi:LmbE family N-acetylglucosaminyl deacetylase
VDLDQALIEPCDALYVSAHEDDVLVSCTARLLSEKAQGLRVTVANVFGGAAAGAAKVLERLGFGWLSFGLPVATERRGRYASYDRACAERDPEDATQLRELGERLTDLALGTRARQVYLPLGVSGHIDRRLCHEAGLAALQEHTGRNIFFYEERPQGLLPGAVRMRLGELGARLPPGAAELRDTASPVMTVLGWSRAPFLAGERLSALSRLRLLARVAARSLAARAWNPVRALGPRLQPVQEVLDRADFPGLVGVIAQAEPRLSALFGSRERLARDAERYARRLTVKPYVERYWLLLPQRAAGGLAPVPLEAAT